MSSGSDAPPVVSCPLCGGRFPGRASCPSGCPMARSCRTLCCPHCGYRFVQDSAVVDLVRRVFRRRAS